MAETLVIAAYVVTFGAVAGYAIWLHFRQRKLRDQLVHRRFVLFGAMGVVALVAVIVATTLSQGLTYYLYPTEAVAQRGDFPDGERFRLAGEVVEGSVSEDGVVTRFTVTDGGASIDAVLTGRVPPLFTDGVPVLVEGSWQGDRFAADQAVIRHDENYETPTEGGAFQS